MEFRMDVHVLLVDDDVDCATALGRLLSANGFVVTPATDPDAAEAILNTWPIDVILSDIRMPGNARLEWTERVLRREPAVPVVLLTGAPELPTAIAAANLPIAAYLLKPPVPGQLFSTLRRAAEAMRRQAMLGPLVEEIRAITARQCLDNDDPKLAYLLNEAAAALALERSRGLYNCGRRSTEAWEVAVEDAVAVLERTKQNFRSKELGALRQRLRGLLTISQKLAPAACG